MAQELPHLRPRPTNVPAAGPPGLLDDDHLAWFVIEAIEELDLEPFYADYRADGHGAAAHEPKMMLVPWAKERGLPEDVASLVGRDEVRELIQAELDRANAKYAQVEQIKKFELLDRDLSQEAGEVTPTGKVKRNVVYERHANLFARMYG
jgi:hypothetical protein